MTLVVIVILILCMTAITCVHLKTHEERKFVFKNSGYEKRIRKLEADVEKMKNERIKENEK